jgi:hypothetical protein
MSQPGVLGALMPASPGDLMRRIVDLERTVRELQGARILNSAAAGDSGLAIIGGAFKMPVIVGGSVPGSMWWDDGFDHHGAIYQQQLNNQLVIQSPWDDSAPNHPAIVFDPVAGILQTYITRDDGVSDMPFLSLIADPVTGSRFAGLLVDTLAGNKYATFILGNGIATQPVAPGTDHGQVFLGQHGSDEHTSVSGAEFFVNANVRTQWVPGDQGLYYYEDWDLAAQAVAAGVQVPLTGMTLGTTRNGYPATALDPSTGLWTSPEDGQYTFTLVAGFDTWASGSRLQLRILNSTRSRTIASRDTNPAVTADSKDTLTARRHCAAGDQVIFQILNGTAASRTVTAAGVEAGYISVQREL